MAGHRFQLIDIEFYRRLFGKIIEVHKAKEYPRSVISSAAGPSDI